VKASIFQERKSEAVVFAEDVIGVAVNARLLLEYRSLIFPCYPDNNDERPGRDEKAYFEACSVLLGFACQREPRCQESLV